MGRPGLREQDRGEIRILMYRRAKQKSCIIRQVLGLFWMTNILYYFRKRERKEGQGNKQIFKDWICGIEGGTALWKIPMFLKELVPEYRIALRHHARFWVAETVYYAYLE